MAGSGFLVISQPGKGAEGLWAQEQGQRRKGPEQPKLLARQERGLDNQRGSQREEPEGSKGGRGGGREDPPPEGRLSK